MFSSISCLVILLLAVTVAQQPQYDVYAAVLRQVVLAEEWGGDPRGSRPPIGRLVIRATIHQLGPGLVERNRHRMTTLENETVANIQSDSEPRKLENQFPEIGPYHLLSDEEFEAMINSGADALYWSSFYQRFPDAPGLVSFSAVAFNPARTQALLRMTHTRAGLWGHSTLYVLARTNNGWQVTERVTIMMS